MLAYLRLVLTAFVSLLATTFGAKVLFALYHQTLHTGLGPAELAGTLLWGLRFDMAVAGILTLLAASPAHLLFRLGRLSLPRALEYATLAVIVPLVLVHGGDLIYFEEAGRHLGYELKEAVNSGGALAGAALGTYTVPVFMQLALLPLALLASRALFRRTPGLHPAAGWRRLLPEAGWVATLLLCVIAARGGLQSVPLEPLHAQQIGEPRKAALALNGAYNALFSSLTPYSIERIMRQRPSGEDFERVRGLYSGSPVTAAATAPNGYNVVFVLLESWTAAYMSSYGYPLETTPNFTRLRRRGISASITVTDAARTTEGMFATFCSTQNPLGATVAQSQLQNYRYECLPEVLRRAGYSSAFFQGSLKNTSGTGAFAQLLGFRESYGRGDMPEPTVEPNNWGRHDPDLYAFALSKMRSLKRPFLVAINTNSTHDRQLPPGVPARFAAEGAIGGFLDVLHYADQALAGFVERVQGEAGTLGPTLFVLLADHAGPAPASPLRRHAIPLAIYGTDRVEPRMLDRVTSQRDVAPTVLDLLGLETPRWFTGKSLLSGEAPPYFANYYSAGEIGWLEGDLLAAVPVRRPDQARCYNYATDPDLREPRTCDETSLEAVERGLSFTRVSQEFLFSGQTTRFADVRETRTQTDSKLAGR